jgi:hypothetical protein
MAVTDVGSLISPQVLLNGRNRRTPMRTTKYRRIKCKVY